MAPDTAAPATPAPGTNAPATAAPATDSPATQAPGSTMAPDTAAPATPAPGTNAPATAAPATDAPATQAPGSTMAPDTAAPATPAPGTNAPATAAPATDAPATQAPGSTMAPDTAAPATPAPGTNAPATARAPATPAPQTGLVALCFTVVDENCDGDAEKGCVLTSSFRDRVSAAVEADLAVGGASVAPMCSKTDACPTGCEALVTVRDADSAAKLGQCSGSSDCGALVDAGLTVRGAGSEVEDDSGRFPWEILLVAALGVLTACVVGALLVARRRRKKDDLGDIALMLADEERLAAERSSELKNLMPAATPYSPPLVTEPSGLLASAITLLPSSMLTPQALSAQGYNAGSPRSTPRSSPRLRELSVPPSPFARQVSASPSNSHLTPSSASPLQDPLAPKRMSHEPLAAPARGANNGRSPLIRAVQV